jgi:hypothetical protein
MSSEILLGLGLLAGGVAFGTQLNVLTVVLPAIRKEDGATGLRLHRTILDHAAHSATAIPAVCVLATSALLLLFSGSGFPDARAPALLAALLGVAGISLTTVAFQVPANKRIRDGAVAPGEYTVVLERWRRVHLLRTLSGALAFGAMVLAALV